MSYTPPTIAPSGSTFAQLRASGFRGQLERLATANALPAATRSLLLGPIDKLKDGIIHSVDAFLQGDPIPTAEINARLLTLATALRSLAAGLDEVNVLVDANPGTLASVPRPGGGGPAIRRSFP